MHYLLDITDVHFAYYLTCYVLLFIILTFTLLIPRYTQLSKYAITAAHEVNAARESASSKSDNNKLRCMRILMTCFF